MSVFTRRVVTNGTVFRIQFHAGDGKWRLYEVTYLSRETAQKHMVEMNEKDARDAGPWEPVDA